MANHAEMVKEAIVKALKANGPYTALIPKGSVCGDTVPAGMLWPFSRIASVLATPFRATGLDSSAFRINVQAFSKDVTNPAGTVLLPAASNVGRIDAAMVDALDLATLALPNGMKVRLNWIQSSPSIDGDEAGAWKVSVVFNAEVSG